MAMHKFDGHPTFNFFANRWTNMLKEMENKCVRNTLGKKMSDVTLHLGATSTRDFATFDQFGNEEEHVHNPFEVLVEPHDIHGWPDEYAEEFHV